MNILKDALSPISSQDNSLSYWKEKLTNISPINLPTDYIRPAVPGSSAAKINFTIEKELLGDLQQLSAEQGVTMFMTLVAGLKVLLHRYSGQNDIGVAVPIANPTRSGMEQLASVFGNILFLRSEANSNTQFIEFLQQVKATTLEAYEHSNVPFKNVAEIVVKENDRSQNPLLQVIFILQNEHPISNVELAEVEVLSKDYESTNVFVQSDFKFIIIETAHGLKATIEYRTDLFSEQTIMRMIGHYKELLSSIIKQPYQKIGLLQMLTAEEEYQLLVGFNDTKVAYPTGKTIVDLFEEQAAKTPQLVAVVFEEKQLTYKELNESANQLAHYLRSKGIREETLVPICIERSLEMIVGIFAILKAGAAYVPIDPKYPEERIRYMLEDINAKIVVSSKESRSKLPTSEGVEVVEIDIDWRTISTQSIENLQTDIQPHHLAYVIYTSGSTGKPKGVMIEHRNVYAFMCWCKQEFLYSRFEIVYVSTSICFDLSIFEIFYPLCIGKPARIIENGLHIGRYLSKDCFVLINSVPVVVENLLKEGTDLSNVSIINMAGEPISLYVQQNLDTERIEVRNLYGPTEDTTYSSVFHLRDGIPVLIGKPISNTKIYILSKKNKLVPIGVAGEICIGGAGLARGYFKRFELTEEKFIEDPFSSDMGSRLYKTGDLGRWLPDGNIEYLGRMDNQVKIRGYRIELGEIESVLQKSERVAQGIVLARQDNSGTKRLVGYVVAKGIFDKEAIITYLKRKLPDYMVPSLWVELEKLPLTSNGKIDRKSLPDPDTIQLLGDQYIAPRNEAESKLVKIWEECLQIQPIGVKDNFFELGGNSIQASQILSKIRKNLGKQLPLSILFKAPTIEPLAIYVCDQSTGIFWSSLVPIQPNGSKPPLFCMHAGAGTVLLYHSLSRYLGPAQPVYGLQAKGLNGNETPHTSIEEMAAHYINEIRSVQQEGPYFLAGYCLGGMLSFEMAQQLTRQGQIVALLASINGVSPTYTVSSDLIEIEEGDNPDENKNSPSKTISHYWKKFMFLSAKEKMVLPLKVLIKKSLTYNQQFRIRKFFYNYYISRNIPLPEALGKHYFLETNGDIARAYKPLPYPGRMIIFRSPQIYPDPYLGWNGFVTGDIETCNIPGKHRNRREIMNEPFVQHTAKELNNYLEAWNDLTFRNKVIKELRV